MAGNDLQRFLKGAMLVAQEFARLQTHESRALLRQTQAHVHEITLKLPRAIPNIMQARGGPAPQTDVPPTNPSAPYDTTPYVPLEAAAPTQELGSAHAMNDWQAFGAPNTSIRSEVHPEPPSAAAAFAASVDTGRNTVSAAAFTDEPKASVTPVQPFHQTTPTPPHSSISNRAVIQSVGEPEKQRSGSILDTPVGAQPDRQALPMRMASRKREFRERAVPASPLSRIFGFGSMAAGMAFGAAGEALQRGLGFGAAGESTAGAASPESGSRLSISEAQAERLAEGLCRMRGAALKIGQMLSLTDDTLLPPQIAAVLERVRTQADIMPKRQLDLVMTEELGADWREKLGGDNFQEKPIAAASIGQVHRSVLPSGESVAIKVQYPGVAESINSDLNNLKRLLTVANFLPKGLYLDSIIKVAREELTAECDYRREAAAQQRFGELVGDDLDFEVPRVISEVSTRRVLTSTFLDGMPIDQVVELGYPQEIRNRIARKLLRLTLKELFDWRYMQTDPNWGNFFYNPLKDTIGLLDFGASREFPKPFVDDYLKLVWAAANRDHKTIEEISVKLGFLTGFESKAMLQAHIESGLVVGEPFAQTTPFDFKASGITARVSKHGATFAEHRLTPPPNEVYSLHRKLAGAFFICIRMGAVIPCRDMLEETYYNYKWGTE